MYAHEKATLFAVAESTARLNGCRYAGIFDANKHSTGDLFFVPDDTLMLDEARDLGVHSPCQLYGAVVPYPFAKTKAITHGLIDAFAARPCAILGRGTWPLANLGAASHARNGRLLPLFNRPGSNQGDGL